MKFWLRFLCVFVLWNVQPATAGEAQSRAATTITESNPQETSSEPTSTGSRQLINPTNLKDALDQLAKEVSAISALATEAKRTADLERCKYIVGLCWLKDFQAFAAGILALVAAIITAVTIYRRSRKEIEAVAKQQRDHEERDMLRHRVRLARSFQGEISSFIDLVNRRAVLEIYEIQLYELKKRLKSKPDTSDFKLRKFYTSEYYFNVYRASCGDLGTFDDEALAENIAKFYMDAIAFMDFLREISRGAFDHISDGYAKGQFYENKVIILGLIISDVKILQRRKQPLIRALKEESDRAKEELARLTDTDEKLSLPADADNELDLPAQPNDSRTKTFNSDGIEIAFIDRGKGGPVLLIHGFASNMTDNWVDSNWVKRLNKAGFRAIAYDNRGHGMSEKFYDKAFYGTEKMAEDAWRLLKHLRIGRAEVIGYSMGALIAARLTMRHPECVRHAIFGGYGINMVNGVTTEALIVGAMEAESIDELTDDLARTLRTSADRTRSNRRALAACAHVAAETIPRGDLEKISVPVLVAVGTGDTIGGSAKELAELMTDARAFDIQRCDHITAVRDEAFKDGVLVFLSGRP